MARRRSVGAGKKRTLAGFGPPAAITNTAPVLDTAGLAAAYEWCAIDTTFGMVQALRWYGDNRIALLYGDPLDADRQRTYDRARKAQAQGDSTTYEGEKTQAYSTALHLLEKLWSSKGLPLLDAPHPPSPRLTPFVGVLDMLNTAFAPINVTYGIHAGAERTFADRRLLLSLAELEAFLIVPPLKTLLGEAPAATQVASVVNKELDGALFMSNLSKALDGIYTWASAAAAPFKGRQKSGAVKAAKITAVSGQPRAAKVPGAMQRAIDLMRAPGGATVADVSAATGWNGDSVRWNISQVMKKKMNLTVVKTGDRYGIV